MNYSITETNECVHICMDCENCNDMDAFIDIYTGDESFNSPFRSVEDAKTFAEILVKLLNVVTNYDIKRH